MAETPNRMAAYNQARAAAGPQKGMNYSELFVDNIFGLDNDYLSAGEGLKQAIKSDPIGFLKNAGISAYEGAKQAVTQPLTTAEAILSGLYDSGVDVASTLGPDPTYLNDALQEMYGVTYDEATDEQVTAAREALFGDVFNVAGVVSGAGAAAKGISALSKSAPVQRFLTDEAGSLLPGPRGMGDNGGPSLESQRYINPNTGMYSPSYEASKSLKQEVGTPQQMRAMLLKAGAKEEELLYSGFDNWLKGKDKVTKKEIEDVLRISAAGDDPSGSMPYVQKQYSSKGLTGYEDQDPYVLRRTVAQDIQSQARDERDARILSELQGRGYRPMKFADEAEFRDMAKRVKEAYSTNLPGLGRDGESRLRLGRVLNALKRAENLMDLDNLDFASRDVQRALQNLSDDNDFLIGPTNLPESSEDIIRRELPEEYRNPYFGSLPIEDRARISDEVDRMSEQELADRLGIDVEDVLNSFDETETEYGAYIVPGIRNYKENLYTYEDAGRGVMSGIEALGVSRFQQPHFSRQGSKTAPIMFHTRTGELQTPEGPAYHMFEAQSDIAQKYRDRPDDFVAPGSLKPYEPSKSEKDLLLSYVDEGEQLEAMKYDTGVYLDRLYKKYLDPDTGKLNKTDPGYEQDIEQIRVLRDQQDELSDRLVELETQNSELFANLMDNYGKFNTVSNSRTFGGDVTLGFGRVSEILSGKAPPSKNQNLRGKTGALPFSSSTNRWLDAALKNELIKAANSDAQWFTLPKGKDVVRMVGGDELGQEKFYEGIVPQRLKKLTKDFLSMEVELKPIKAKGYGSKGEEYDVLGMRLTPEVKKAILEGGFPSFAKGGPVKGSSLDVDVFALP